MKTQRQTQIEKILTLRLYADSGDAGAVLTRKEWAKADDIVDAAFKRKTPAVQRIMESCLYQRQEDISLLESNVMTERRATEDNKHFGIINLPLPFTWCEVTPWSHPEDFYTRVEISARRVAETIEAVTLGTRLCSPGETELYGLTNTPGVIRHKLANPEVPHWTSSSLVGDVLEMTDGLKRLCYYGPYCLFYGYEWKHHFKDDYAGLASRTLEEKILGLEGIGGLILTPALSDYTIVLAQLTPDVIRMIVALRPKLVQWSESEFRVVSCIVPQIRKSFAGDCGVVVGVSSPVGETS